ncbi:MAG TPA: hypothetical protein GX711_06690, partial [Clostridia bacterium]|nr:hypothetical protein [Clostridia bacterium]
MRAGKKICRLLLIGLIVLFLSIPAAIASEQVGLVFNGQEYAANVYLENGVCYIATDSLIKIPGISVEQT